LTAYFIILATAVTLHVAGITDINTAAEAASALRPLAGEFAYILFGLGILGVGLIGVPVLAGSGAYALAETMGWNTGLERKATDARGFYGIKGAKPINAYQESCRRGNGSDGALARPGARPRRRRGERRSGARRGDESSKKSSSRPRSALRPCKIRRSV
jgi:hypothetical protein